MPHLSYIGDADDRRAARTSAPARSPRTSRTAGRPEAADEIGRDVRVGVDTVFVAPVTLGDDAWTAAGTVVTDDVPDNALAGFPPRQTMKEGRGGKSERLSRRCPASSRRRRSRR